MLSAENFAYWLQGYFELTDSGQQMSAQQVEVIKEHLALVFKKETARSINYAPLVFTDKIELYSDKLPILPFDNSYPHFIWSSHEVNSDKHTQDVIYKETINHTC